MSGGRPEAVAFDVVETLFSLEGLRGRLSAAGLPPHALEIWFASLFRDAFALEAAGTYRPFREVAESSLRVVLAAEGADTDRADEILAGFGELDAHPDVAPAVQALRDQHVRVFALTNGSAEVTGKLIARAGLAEAFERWISIDEVQRWKPAAAVYRHCAEVAGVQPPRLALVAAHGWDIHGAAQAGLMTGYVGRRGALFPPAMKPPTVHGATLTEVIERLLALG